MCTEGRCSYNTMPLYIKMADHHVFPYLWTCTDPIVKEDKSGSEEHMDHLRLGLLLSRHGELSIFYLRPLVHRTTVQILLTIPQKTAFGKKEVLR